MSTQDLSGGGFNFDTQEGVAHLLASVRAANLPAEQKNDLRDTIFLYTNGGRDQTVRLALEQKLQTYGIVPTEQRSTQKPPASTTPVSPMSYTRTTPNNFSVSAKPAQQPASPAPTPAPSTPTPPPPAQPPAPQPSTPPTPPTPPPTSPTPQPAPPTPTPPTPPTPPAPTPVQTPPPTPSAQSAPVVPPASAPVVAHDPDTFLVRIREIKSIVNQKIGNPVNLVDINNEVGREYMGALLDAMKKINSGASAVSAMQRLEVAFQAVEKTIAEHDAGVPPSPTPPAPTPAPSTPTPPPPAQPPAPQPSTPPTPPTPPPTSPTPQPAPPTPTPPTPPTPPAPTPVQTPPPTPSAQSAPVVPPASAPEAPKQNSTPIPPPAPPQTEQPTETVTPKPPAPEPVPPSPPPAEQPTEKKPVSAPIPPPAATATQPASNNGAENKPVSPPENRVPLQDIPNPNQKASAQAPEEQSDNGDEDRWSGDATASKSAIRSVSSLADTLANKDAEKQAKTKEVQKKVSGDPLYTPEIDEGLEQLLSEWSLFKKSGLFGTGPKGRNHPLFKKIAGLQIPLLLAGRFEGATQEIKQSITDYMNGWRYEQGVIYNQGETFERYLRRVIKHILDLQKKKTPA